MDEGSFRGGGPVDVPFVDVHSGVFALLHHRNRPTTFSTPRREFRDADQTCGESLNKLFYHRWHNFLLLPHSSSVFFWYHGVCVEIYNVFTYRYNKLSYL